MSIETAVRRTVGEAGMWAGTAVVLLGLLLIGMQSTFLAGAAVGLAAFLLLLVCFDLRQAGTILVTLAMFLAPLNDLRLGASYVTASDILFVLGFGVLTPTILHHKIQIPPAFTFGLSLLLVMGAIASVASPIPIVSANQVARLMVGAFLLPIFFMIWRPPTTIIVRFAGAYIFGTTFSVMWGLLQGPVAAGGGRYIGFTYHPNYLGLSCLLAASLTPYVVAMIRPQFRWMFWGAALICAYGVYISGSRAALLVLVMLIVVYPFVERSIRAVGVVMLGVVAVLVFADRILKEDSDSAIGRLLGGGTASGSDLDRERIAAAAWDQFWKHPLLGNGFDGGIGSHNIYLQVATAVGIFGLLGYLMIMWTAIRPLFWKGTGHRLAYPVLAYAAEGPITNTLWDRLIWAVIALTFAESLRMIHERNAPPADTDPPVGVPAETRNS